MNPQIIGILTQKNYRDFFSDSPRQNSLNEIALCPIIEFRGDTFLPEEIPPKLALIKSNWSEKQGRIPKILFTLRLACDGGKWIVSPAARWELWEKCIGSGLVDWIDIELEEIEESRGLVDLICSSSQVKMLLSHHHFSSSYSAFQFEQKLTLMEVFNPDMVKFAVTLQTREDFIEMLVFSKKLSEKFPLSCCISMGIWGKMSRIGSPLIGAPITYGFLGDSEVVSGQLSVKKLDNYLKLIHALIPKGISEEALVSLLEVKMNDE